MNTPRAIELIKNRLEDLGFDEIPSCERRLEYYKGDEESTAQLKVIMADFKKECRELQAELAFLSTERKCGNCEWWDKTLRVTNSDKCFCSNEKVINHVKPITGAVINTSPEFSCRFWEKKEG